MAENTFLTFCRHFGLKCDGGPGALGLDYAPSCGGYRIVQYGVKAPSAEHTPFGAGRCSAAQMVSCLNFAMDLDEWTKKGNQQI